MKIPDQQPHGDEFEVTRIKDGSPVNLKHGTSRRDFLLRASLLGIAIATPVGVILFNASHRNDSLQTTFPDGPLPSQADAAFDEQFGTILQPGKEIPIIDAIVPVGSDIPRFKRTIRQDQLHHLDQYKEDLLYTGKNENHPLIEKVIRPMYFLGDGSLWLLYQSDPFGHMVLVNAGDPNTYLNTMTFATISSVKPEGEAFHPSRGHNVIKAAVNFIPEQVMYSIPG